MTEIILQYDEDERIRFSSLEEGGFRRFDEVRQPCQWRTRGTELVDYVDIRLENTPEEQ